MAAKKKAGWRDDEVGRETEEGTGGMDYGRAEEEKDCSGSVVTLCEQGGGRF